jgi:hypothetical protein
VASFEDSEELDDLGKDLIMAAKVLLVYVVKLGVDVLFPGFLYFQQWIDVLRGQLTCQLLCFVTVLLETGEHRLFSFVEG